MQLLGMLLYLVVVVSLHLAPALAGDVCAYGDGASYRGYVSTAVGGLQCQRWDRQYPHKHSRTPSRYPTSGLESNYCRNPDGEPHPWCYTTTSSKRWAFCGVPTCKETTYNCYHGNGAAYRGTVRQTEKGKICQRWDSQSPHKHTRTRGTYPDAGLEGNYCRNPDGEPRPWCYTVDSGSRWEFCNIPPC